MWLTRTSRKKKIDSSRICSSVYIISKNKRPVYMHIVIYVLFRTHLAKIKCFNLRTEDGLEVNVVLEAQPSALRNREAIRVHQIKTRALARCVLKDLVLSHEL